VKAAGEVGLAHDGDGSDGRRDNGLADRAERTLALMHRWGYAPTVDSLARELLGGSVSADALLPVVAGEADIAVDPPFVYLRGRGDLVAKSRARRASDSVLNGSALALADEFARDLVRLCPFLDCIAVSGSVASGGFAAGDDIDFDLFVRSGTKYTAYLVATLVGLKFSWRFRDYETDAHHRTPFLPKIMCINVVWPEDQTKPFVRRDAAVAFELEHCTPIYGSKRFRAVLQDNPWIRDYFPQVYDRRFPPTSIPGPSPVARFLASVARHRWALGLVESLCRGISRSLYRFVQASRARDPEVAARMAFLRRAKFPYEVFQD
jgi:hypothetical protein